MSKSITHAEVHRFIEEAVGPDTHAKRVLSLSNATLGAVHAASLSVRAIGLALSQARGLEGKHAIKQVDRLLSNSGVDVWRLFAQWVPFVVAERKAVTVTIDWTDVCAARAPSSVGRTDAACWRREWDAFSAATTALRARPQPAPGR
ncbi:hypothetical protein [Corallococcus macrosporus]|uniref:Transposase n=1 Tax=Corallococcus macrosporus DSM 14697 TaxID=1189310 RepID=A0A250K0N5_9BACT|nr:hypothetical protein [Corallococcus macrosporus]ATB49297.1 transposase [Corallococcus macrosporus DSM 14697]